MFLGIRHGARALWLAGLTLALQAALQGAEAPDRPSRTASSASADALPFQPEPIQPGAPSRGEESGFAWKPAARQAALGLTLQHGFRVALQPKTRRELGGPFWSDYVQSLKGIQGWDDGDSDLVNYAAHPLMGAMAGQIQIQNDPRGATVEFGRSSEYWRSRLRALGFSGAYTLAFEAAPVSEASIGNVGLRPGTNGAVDFVVTPAGGFAFMVAEDALDRFLVRHVEGRSSNRFTRGLVRCVFTPARSLARLLAAEPPWRRPGRPL